MLLLRHLVVLLVQKILQLLLNLHFGVIVLGSNSRRNLRMKAFFLFLILLVHFMLDFFLLKIYKILQLGMILTPLVPCEEFIRCVHVLYRACTCAH